VPIFPWPTPDLRPVGLFTQTVPEIPWDRHYGAGVKFQPLDLTDLTLVATPDTWCVEESDPTGGARACVDFETQTAFQIMDIFGASSLEYTAEEMQANVRERWPLLISEALAREFLAGSGGSNHNLTADGVGVTTPSTVHEGIAELEEQMALGLGNTLGMIHMTPSALVYGVTNGTVSYNGGRYYSPGGHLVVADAGYQVSETTTTTMWGTGLVRYAVSESLSRMDDIMSGVPLSAFKNQLLWLEQAIGIIIFDPNTVYKTVATRA
jgi:hypothetical protein